MKKRIALSAILALISLVGLCESEASVKVGSVKITKGDTLSPYPISQHCIYHGNATAKIIAENPTGAPITLESVFNLGYRPNSPTFTALTKLPANSTNEIALPIPLALYSSYIRLKQFSTIDHNNHVATKDYPFNIYLEYQRASQCDSFRSAESNRSVKAKSLYSYPRLDYFNIIVSPSLNFEALNDDYRDAIKKLYSIKISPEKNDDFNDYYKLNNIESKFSSFKNWQELATLDAIVISNIDSKDLPQKFLEILPNWIAAGGQLVLIGDCTIKGLESASEGNYGLGAIIKYKDKIDWSDLIPRLDTTFTTLSRVQAKKPKLKSDIAALEAISTLSNEAPFGSIIILLLAFSIIAGPVTIIILARKNERLKLLWIFPLIATIFSIATIVIILCTKGISPSLYQYAYTLVDAQAGKVITAQNDIIVAPFRLKSSVKFSSNAMLSFADRSFNLHQKGAEIIYTGDEFVLNSKWVPSLWPTTFSSMTIRDIASIPELNAAEPTSETVITNNLPLGVVTMPIDERLQKHTLKHIIEWRR